MQYEICVILDITPTLLDIVYCSHFTAKFVSRKKKKKKDKEKKKYKVIPYICYIHFKFSLLMSDGFQILTTRVYVEPVMGHLRVSLAKATCGNK